MAGATPDLCLPSQSSLWCMASATPDLPSLSWYSLCLSTEDIHGCAIICNKHFCNGNLVYKNLPLSVQQELKSFFVQIELRLLLSWLSCLYNQNATTGQYRRPLFALDSANNGHRYCPVYCSSARSCVCDTSTKCQPSKLMRLMMPRTVTARAVCSCGDSEIKLCSFVI